MRLLILLTLAIRVSNVLGQTLPSKGILGNTTVEFSLVCTTYNYAGRLFDGTTAYQLTNTTIKVINYSWGEENGKVKYSKVLAASREAIKVIERVRLKALKPLYYNFCSMPTSGDEYFIDFKSAQLSKHIRLHNYYLEELETIIELINSNLPVKYQLHYLEKNTKQNCEL